MLLFYEIETETKARVTGIHYMPEQLTEEERAEGIEVTTVPEPVHAPGKITALYVNPTTAAVWYEYVSRPLSDREMAEKVQTENTALRTELDQVKADSADTTSILLELFEMLAG